MNFSEFGSRFSGSIGINELMDDLGAALSGDRSMRMLGGGNPAHIPAVQACFRERMAALLEDKGRFEDVVGNYDGPQGASRFIEALSDLLRRDTGWDIGPENIALTNGSQNSFFMLFNLFSGRFPGGQEKRILLPLSPEYIGYSHVGLTSDIFRAVLPKIAYPEDDLFKYHVDFERLSVSRDTGAMCISRPTNPSGNMVSDDEMQILRELADTSGIPLVVDSAYGMPFPNIVFEPARAVWDPGMVVCLSLSKFGLPGLRTGIVIAHPDIIRMVSRMTAVFSLAPGSMGAALTYELVRSGEIIRLSHDIIRPFYKAKAQRALAMLRTRLEGLPYAIHQPGGALFLWLWLKGLPVTSRDLYNRLKARGVLVVPGHHFCVGLDEYWKHGDECIRVTFAQDDTVVEEGIALIADEVRKIYAGG